MSEASAATETAPTEAEQDAATDDKKTTASKTTTKGTSNQSTAAKPANGKSITDLFAKAASTGKVVKSDNLLVVPLSQITDVKYNGRREPEHLCEGVEDEVYLLVGAEDDVMVGEEEGAVEEMRSLLHMALSDDIVNAKNYVQLIEDNECVNREEHPDGPQSIVELAEDIKRYGQIVPAILKESKDGYTLLDGARRMAAILYLYCLSRINKTKNQPPVLLAVTTDVSQRQLLPISFTLNNSRKNLTLLQEGKCYHEMKQQKNHKTGKTYTLKEVAEEVGVLYNTVRGRESVYQKPRKKKDLRTGEMKDVGCTENDREQVRNGNKSWTWLMRKALGEPQAHAKAGESQNTTGTKIKPKTRKEMEELLDNSGDAAKDFKRAIALCLGFPDTKAGLKKASDESEARVALAEQKAVRQAAAKTRRAA